MIDASRTTTSSASAPRVHHRATAAPRSPPPTPQSLCRASGSTRCVPIRLQMRLVSASRAPVQSCRGHITRQRGRSRSFVQANDMPKRNLERDPPEIRFTDGSNDEWRVLAREDHASGGAEIFLHEGIERTKSPSEAREKLQVYRRVISVPKENAR